MDAENLREKFEFHKKWLESKMQDGQSINSKRSSQTESVQSIFSLRGKSEPPRKDAKIRSAEIDHESDGDIETVETFNNVAKSQNEPGSLDKNVDQSDSEEYLYRDFFEGSKRPKRWESLYSLNKKIIRQKELNEKQTEQKKNELDPECTFQPRLVSAKPFYMTNKNQLSIHERNKQWKERKDAKIALTREVVKDKDLAGCTFKPEVDRLKTSNNFEGITEYQSKGILTYLQRQVVARKAKEEKEALLNNPLKKLPESNARKEGRMTIPKEPKLNTNARAIEYASKKNATQFSKYSQGASNLGSALVTPLGERHVENQPHEEYSEDNSAQVKDPNFVHALGTLHSQLYKFDIRYG